MDMRLLPQPAPPQMSVGLPRGSPPPVISSRPEMPVGHLGNVCKSDLVRVAIVRVLLTETLRAGGALAMGFVRGEFTDGLRKRQSKRLGRKN